MNEFMNFHDVCGIHLVSPLETLFLYYFLGILLFYVTKKISLNIFVLYRSITSNYTVLFMMSSVISL